MSDIDKTREELVQELSALRERMAKLQEIEGEKSQADEKGRLSDKQFQELTAHIHQVLWIIDAKESKILYVSPAYERMWGRSCQSLIDNPRSYMEGIHPLDQEMMRREDAVQYQTGHIDAECRVMRPDGSVRWVWIRGYPVRDQQGQIVRIVGVIEDTTRRKATEQALHISLERNSAILRASLDAIVTIDHEGKVVDFNAAAQSLFGYSQADVAGKEMSQLIIPPQMRERHRDGLARYLATGEGPILNKRLEMPACRADGTEFLCELTITPIEGEGEPLFTGFMRDITQEKTLQDDRARLAAIVEFSIYAIVSKTVDGIIISWNHGAEGLYGYSAKEMIGQSISILFGPDHFQEYVEIMEAVKKGVSIPSYDTVRRRKDGTEVNVSLGISPIKNKQGEVVEASTISHNITEGKDSEEQMRLLLESTGEGIYGIDLQGRCTFINHAGATMLNYDPAEVIGQNMHTLIHHHRPDSSPYPVEQCPIYLAMQTQSGVRVRDEVLWRKDGRSFAAEYSSFPVKKSEIILGAVVTFQDVTQTKQLEQQFRQAQKMEAVGRLAGGVAHDFNNLLTIISGYSEILLTAVPLDDPNRRFLTEIKRAGERAASLTRQLVAFSRKQILEHKVLDLNAVVAGSEKMVKRLVGEDVDLVTILDPALGHVKTDPGQMEQVVMNLVVNARDAMPQGGKIAIETTNVVLDEIYCDLHPEVEPGRYIMLAVSDNGCGMDEQTKARVFEPFFTTKALGQGTGLGLAMIHGFIKQSGGHVSVHSEPRVGSTFKIFLPEYRGLQPLEKPHPVIEKMPHGSETILLVEDEAGVRAISRHVLQTCGYTVLEAAHGGEAIRLAEKHPGSIHLLLTDVVMPGMGGRLVAERILALKPGAKVLYLSGYTDDAVVRHGVLQSETDFLQKPFTPSALAVKVRQVLDNFDFPVQ